MTDSRNNADGGGGFVGGFFNGMPNWAKAIVYILVAPTLVLAISGMMLQVNVGAVIDKYMELYFARQLQATENSADRIISAVDVKFDDINARIDELAKSIGSLDKDINVVEKRVEALEFWACDHAATQGLRDDWPGFCEPYLP